MGNLMQLTEDLKAMPDMALQQEMMNPSGVVPGYLLLAEAQRRQLMRQAAQRQAVEGQPQTSVYQDVLRNMTASQPPAGPAPAGMTPVANNAPPTPGATPPQNFRPPQQLAEGGEVDDGDDGDEDVPTVSSIGSASRERPDPYADLIASSAGKYNVRPELVRSVIAAESNNNPAAVSKKGATGLMQLLPGTAAQYGYKPEDLTDPAKNIDAGTHYLHDLETQYGTERDALIGYNYGPGSVAKHPGFTPKETNEYLNRVEQGIPGGFRDLSVAQLGPSHPSFAGPIQDVSYSVDRRPYAVPPLPYQEPVQPDLGAPPAGVTTGVAPDASMPDYATAAIPAGERPPATRVEGVDYDTVYNEIAKRFPSDDAASRSIAASRAQVAQIGKQLEQQSKPNLWRMLGDFGWGLAAAPGGPWIHQVGLAGQAMNKTQEQREDQWRKEQLALLGVDVRLQDQAREHEDKLADIRERATGQATAQLIAQSRQREIEAREQMREQAEAQRQADAREAQRQNFIMSHQLSTGAIYQPAGATKPAPGWRVIPDQMNPGNEWIAPPIHPKMAASDIPIITGIGQTLAAHPEYKLPTGPDGEPISAADVRITDLPAPFQKEAMFRIKQAKEGWTKNNIETALADPATPADLRAAATAASEHEITQAGKVSESRTKGTQTAKAAAAPPAPELTTQGQHQLDEQQRVGAQFDDLLTRVLPFTDPNKGGNDPMTLVGPLAKYRLGIKSDEGTLGNDLSNLQLASIQGVMPFARGSRNYHWIQDIGQHLPNLKPPSLTNFTMPDSPAMIYDKLLKARRNFLRMDASTMRYELKKAGPNAPKPTLDPDRAAAYLRVARDDPKAATQMAIEDGWTVPE